MINIDELISYPLREVSFTPSGSTLNLPLYVAPCLTSFEFG